MLAVLILPCCKFIYIVMVTQHCQTFITHTYIVRGVSRWSLTGGPNESLFLAPWSKVEEWRPTPSSSPHRQFGAPEVFFPEATHGAPLVVLEWRPIRHVDLSFSIFFPFFPSFFLSFSSPFLSFFFFFFGAL